MSCQNPPLPQPPHTPSYLMPGRLFCTVYGTVVQCWGVVPCFCVALFNARWGTSHCFSPGVKKNACDMSAEVTCQLILQAFPLIPPPIDVYLKWSSSIYRFFHFSQEYFPVPLFFLLKWFSTVVLYGTVIWGQFVPFCTSLLTPPSNVQNARVILFFVLAVPAGTNTGRRPSTHERPNNQSIESQNLEITVWCLLMSLPFDVCACALVVYVRLQTSASTYRVSWRRCVESVEIRQVQDASSLYISSCNGARLSTAVCVIP